MSLDELPGKHPTSIRPRLWGRGETPCRSFGRPRRVDFNSATAVGPWREGACGPGWAPPGGHFNSATAVGPWRARCEACGTCIRRTTSIRPRLWGRGELVAADKPSATDVALQFGHGCGAVERRHHDMGAKGRIGLLQFGHGCGAVERRGVRRFQRPSQVTSIRPRLWGRGEVGKVATAPAGQRKLQFGHGCGAVERAGASPRL